MVAYDEIYSIKFFGKKLRPYLAAQRRDAGRSVSDRPSAIIRRWSSAARNSTAN